MPLPCLVRRWKYSSSDCQSAVIWKCWKKSACSWLSSVVGGRDGVAFAGDLRGDALRQLADRLLVDEQVDLRLAEHVDEAGSDDQAGGVDGALGRQRSIGLADEGNAIADDADVGVNPRIAAAIDHAAVADEVIELLGQRRNRKSQNKEKQQEFVS